MLSAVLILSSCWNTAIIKVIKKSEVIRPRKSLNLLEISGQQDLNLRPHGPQPCALPSYAIPRNAYNYNINEL